EATDSAILSAHLNSPPTPPRERNPLIPEDLERIILKALAKDPAQRFRTASEFRDALQKIGTLPAEATATKPIAVPDGARLTPSPFQSGAGWPSGAKSGPLEMAYV